MASLIIEGHHKLRGDVWVSGMKNAATPIIASTMLTEEECIISNVPRIVDVFKMLALLEGMGAQVEWSGDHELTICCKHIDPEHLDQPTVRSMRSSVLLIGALLGRFSSVTISQPGGCIIGNRPLDTHLDAMKSLGASIHDEPGQMVFRRSQLRGAPIVLSEFSVTATENVLMAAVLAEGTTTLHIAAAEPHVQDLACFLRKMGAKISGEGTHTIVIEGVKKLNGASHRIIPDQIETGTFAAAAVVMHGNVRIHGVEPSHLDLILLKMRQAGAQFSLKDDILEIHPSTRLKAFKLQTMPYPGFPTDLQAPFGVLATQAEGTTLIHDPMFEGRLGYIQELVKMGANAIICDPHRVLITGPTPLYGQEIRSFDLRAGATLIVAGLLAQGVTTLHDVEIVDRGYENIDERLRMLGAHITRKNDA